MTSLRDIDDTDLVTALALPDPARVNAAAKRALRLAKSFHLVECRGGFRAGDAKVSLASASLLEASGLARKQIVRHRYELICTDAGREFLALLDKKKGSRS